MIHDSLGIPRSLFPFSAHQVPLGETFSAVIDEGEGVPVVMLHGNPTWSFYYRELIAALRPHYRCIAIDHVGCGRAGRPSRESYRYTLEERVANIHSILEARGVGRFHLVAHDWGGMIGSALATEVPERVLSLTLMNTGAFPKPKGYRMPWQIGLARSPALGHLLVQGFNAFVEGMLVTCTTQPMSPEIEDGYRAPYRSWTSRRAIKAFVDDIPSTGRHPSMPALRRCEAALSTLRNVPVHLVWGMQDYVFDEAFLKSWQDYLPHAQVTSFAEAGHLVLEDAGAEACRAIEDFIRASQPEE